MCSAGAVYKKQKPKAKEVKCEGADRVRGHAACHLARLASLLLVSGTWTGPLVTLQCNTTHTGLASTCACICIMHRGHVSKGPAWFPRMEPTERPSRLPAQSRGTCSCSCRMLVRHEQRGNLQKRMQRDWDMRTAWHLQGDT
jgi:hypothetical protein